MADVMEELTYDKFIFAVNKIADRIKNFNVTSIYGIPRGGQVVAVYLSHLTGLPIVDNPKNAYTLIVDDIVDTGRTLEKYKAYMYAKTATIYYHKQSVIEPDIWIFEKKDEFIKFPWETNKSAKVDYGNNRIQK